MIGATIIGSILGKKLGAWIEDRLCVNVDFVDLEKMKRILHNIKIIGLSVGVAGFASYYILPVLDPKTQAGIIGAAVMGFTALYYAENEKENLKEAIEQALAEQENTNQ